MTPGRCAPASGESREHRLSTYRRLNHTCRKESERRKRRDSLPPFPTELNREQKWQMMLSQEYASLIVCLT
ncbi:hypothetical protein KCP70_16190 [Salmonella enterica subsp. enterica]|nr:hypothetical protein KCP70_16190 [Salmonella enterica subsp. enterica]